MSATETPVRAMAEAFGAFAATTSFDALPERAVAAATTGFTDFAACVFLGLHDPVMPMIRGSLDTVGRGRSRLAFGTERACAAEAALHDGAAAHASHIDDNALRNNHVSSVLAACVLAAGTGKGASGKALIAAYVTGYEVWARLVGAERDGYAPHGWHATGVLGSVAAAAAVANLHGATPAVATAAIAAAGSLSGGISGNFNDWVKPYQVGRAAQSGVIAVRLAEAGFGCSPDALDGRTGLLAALSPKGRVDAVATMRDFGTGWRIVAEGVNLKRYPMALPVHRALDGMFELLDRDAFRAEDIERIDLEIGASEQAVLAPRLGGPGRFKPLISVELALAAAIIARDVSAAQMVPEFYRRADVAALMEKVRIRVDEGSPAERDPNLAYGSVVAVTVRDGRVVASTRQPTPLGNWTSPLSRAQLWKKFRRCTEGRLSEEQARALFDQLQDLPLLDTAEALGAGLETRDA